MAAEDEEVPETIQEILPRGLRGWEDQRRRFISYFPTLMKVSRGQIEEAIWAPGHTPCHTPQRQGPPPVALIRAATSHETTVKMKQDPYQVSPKTPRAAAASSCVDVPRS